MLYITTHPRGVGGGKVEEVCMLEKREHKGRYRNTSRHFHLGAIYSYSVTRCLFKGAPVEYGRT